MRDASTYRAQRREAWKLRPAEPWVLFNRKQREWDIGSMQSLRVTMRSKREGRSRYMPHQGQQEMARRLRQAA